MKSRRGILALVMLVLFELFWWWINRNGLKELSLGTADALIDAVTPGAGFNCFIDHGALYTFAFLAFASGFVPQLSEVQITRMTRWRWALSFVKDMAGNALIFSSVFVFVMFSNIAIITRGQFVKDKLFLLAFATFYLSVFLYYFFIGALYFLCIILFKKKNTGIVIVTIASIMLMVCTDMLRVWTVLMGLDVLELYYMECLSSTYVFNHILKSLLIIISLILVSGFIFKENDILVNKEI